MLNRSTERTSENTQQTLIVVAQPSTQTTSSFVKTLA